MKWGSHLAISGHGLVESIQHIIEIGGSALQIFISPNRGSSPGRPITKQEADIVKTILKNTGVYLVIHGKYILNFCSPKVMWYHEALVADLRKANQLGSSIGVVIHQGKNKADFNQTKEEAIKTYVGHLEKVLDETKDIKNPIILENSCKQGNEIGYTIEELSEIYHTFHDKYKNRVKFCIDTCHIFVAGTLQFNNPAEVDEAMRRFDRLIGLEKLEVIHFNDSKTPFHGKNDHHHDIGFGYITNQTYNSSVKKYEKMVEMGAGRGSIDGLKRLVGWAKTFDIPLILETPLEESDRPTQVEMLGKWVAEEEEINYKLGDARKEKNVVKSSKKKLKFKKRL